jgi:peptidyl-tRNA hydrolase
VIPARRDVRKLALAALIPVDAQSERAAPATRCIRSLPLAALIPLAGLMVVATASSYAADIGTAFSYQGSLEKPAGTPVTDTCDFRFGLWDALTGGNQKGTSPQTETAVEVVGGVFTVAFLDFGPGAIDGTARWLAIEVQCPGDAAFVLLDPRVELTPAPYSIRAGEGVGGPNALNVTPSGDVGIGTTAPSEQLHVTGNAKVDGTVFTNAVSGNSSLELKTGVTTRIHISDGPTVITSNCCTSHGSTGCGDGGCQTSVCDQDSYCCEIEWDQECAARARILCPSLCTIGGVGIGTTTPAARLDVNGAARTTTLEITGGSPLQQPLSGWGNNGNGQINVPAGTFTAVAAGEGHSLAIRSDGTLTGWGTNGAGQINVPSGTFTAVAAGGSHSIAIRSDGTLAGWGDNTYGQISVPAGTFTAVAGGWLHSLAIRSDGTLVGWGYNLAGQIDVPAGTFTAVAAGNYHSLAIRTDETLVGWGNNSDGQTNVPAGTFRVVSAGAHHGLALRSDGTLVGWGWNYFGQTDVPAGTFTAVSGGVIHSVAIRSDGTLVGWGNNNNGQIDVPAGTFVAVGAGNFHSLAIRSDPDGGGALVLHNNSAYKPGSDRWTIFSDRRLKKNIEPLSGALERLLQLRGVTFQWLDPASQGGITGTQMGLIADEVSRAFPQWVGRDPKGYQTLTVGGFEALTAEALRELRAEKDCEIEDLKSEITDLKELVKALSAKQNGGGR